jgi:hypothetical protein
LRITDGPEWEDMIAESDIMPFKDFAKIKVPNQADEVETTDDEAENKHWEKSVPKRL